MLGGRKKSGLQARVSARGSFKLKFFGLRSRLAGTLGSVAVSERRSQVCLPVSAGAPATAAPGPHIEHIDPDPEQPATLVTVTLVGPSAI